METCIHLHFSAESSDIWLKCVLHLDINPLCWWSPSDILQGYLVTLGLGLCCETDLLIRKIIVAVCILLWIFLSCVHILFAYLASLPLCSYGINQFRSNAGGSLKSPGIASHSSGVGACWGMSMPPIPHPSALCIQPLSKIPSVVLALVFNIQWRDNGLFLPPSTQWRLKGVNLRKLIHMHIIFH